MPFNFSRREDDVERSDLNITTKDETEPSIEEANKPETSAIEEIKVPTSLENPLGGEKMIDESLQKDRYKKTLRLSSNDIVSQTFLDLLFRSSLSNYRLLSGEA
jgi:hypothetical protein